MTKTRFIGDVHGYKYELGLVLGNIPDDVTSVIQVGDMGVGFGQGDYWHESLEDMMQAVNGRFIRGNHDDPAQCKEMRTWIQDGRIENDVMFIGGAWSIDHQWRTMGVDLWEDEELSTHQLYGLISVYDMVRPRVMVTHDCPLSVSNKLFIEKSKSFSKMQYRTRTGSAFEEMFSIHKPKLHIFGHWHCDADEVINGTRFICLNELSYVDVDMETLEVTWPDYQNKRMKP
jgi:Icc-related predicted phosphoesterase